MASADDTTPPVVALPLTPSHVAALNVSTPHTSRHGDKLDGATTYATHDRAEVVDIETDGNDDGDSSPFLEATSSASEVASTTSTAPTINTITTLSRESEQENISPSKPRPVSRVISGTELSPLKILQDRAGAPADADKGDRASGLASTAVPGDSQKMPPPPIRSPRKLTSPDKRFPVRISSPNALQTPRARPSQSQSQSQSQPQPQPQKPQHQRQMSVEDAMRENEGLRKAIDILEDDVSGSEDDSDHELDDSTIDFRINNGGGGSNGHGLGIAGLGGQMPPVTAPDEVTAGIDDTMMSSFSTFSAVPNMTMFAKLGLSPGKYGNGGFDAPTPKAGGVRDREHTADVGNTTAMMLEFTEQLRFAHAQQQQQHHHHHYHQQQQSPSAHGGRTSPVRSGPASAETPAGRKSFANLMDFDLPPMPTPRSVPTITPRELESLKSSFLSEISSLKASLSGKEAEAQSLKTAVGDAEKRVGRCMEQLREQTSLRESLESEKEVWERRGREMEAVLRKVKEEIVAGQRDRDELEAKLNESEQRRDMAETMAQEAESKVAAMRAGKAAEVAAAAAAGANSENKTASPGGGSGSGGKSLTPRDVEIAVERVARDLHARYKVKHTEKCAALKQSYARRWEKKVRELEEKVEDLARENEDYRAGRNATMTRIDPVSSAAMEEERKAREVKDAAEIKELHAEVERLEAMVRSVRGDNDELRRLLELERVEKGELVMLAEEMMSMQQSFIGNPAGAGSNHAANGVGGSNGGGGGRIGNSNNNNNNNGSSLGRSNSIGGGRSQSSNNFNRDQPTPRAAPTPGRTTASTMGGVGTTPSKRHSMLQQPTTSGSLSRPSGLRAPGSLAGPRSGISRPVSGIAQHHERKRSAPLVPAAAARGGGLMSSIEKMGSYSRGA